MVSTWFITGCSTGLGRDLAAAVIDAELNQERAELDGMRQLGASTDFPL